MNSLQYMQYWERDIAPIMYYGDARWCSRCEWLIPGYDIWWC
jgi:hypothetical protein